MTSLEIKFLKIFSKISKSLSFSIWKVDQVVKTDINIQKIIGENTRLVFMISNDYN